MDVRVLRVVTAAASFSLTRIAPLLTSLAISGVVIAMLGAFAFHLQAGRFAKRRS